MTHLSRDEQVLALDDALPARRRAHVDWCARCRDEVAALAAVVAAVQQAPVPEPSPLFWDHFSARVRDAVGAEPPPIVPVWRRRGWRLALTGAAVTAGVALVLLQPPGRRDGAATAGRVQPAATGVPAVPGRNVRNASPAEAVHTADDETWRVLLALADETPLTEEETLALPSRPGQAELAAADLSDEERAALVALLTEAIAAPAGRRAS